MNSLVARITLVSLSLFWPALGHAEAPATTELELDDQFEGYEGCFVILDVRRGAYARFNPERCAKRYSPCSTFKIPNSLIGLETGVLEDANHTIEWDGVERRRQVLNRDHDLRSALKNSVVWYYQEVASEVGEKRMKEMIDALGYGNRDISGGLTRFWLDDSLKISADEQVEFLRRFHAGELPFSKRSLRIVKEILILSSGTDCVLRGKTGSGVLKEGGIGWFVGYLSCEKNTHVFATNIEGAEGANGHRAKAITLTVLKTLGLY